MKLTFKKHPRSKGLAGIGEGDYVDLKIKGKRFGLISGGSAFNRGYSIQFAYKYKVENKEWDWFFISRNVKTLEEAKAKAEFVIEDFARNHEIHFFEE